MSLSVCLLNLQVRLAEQLKESNVMDKVVGALMALRTKAGAEQSADMRIDFSQVKVGVIVLFGMQGCFGILKKLCWKLLTSESEQSDWFCQGQGLVPTCLHCCSLRLGALPN